MKLSFVIPSFNSVEWLPHAVESCFNQTYKDIEVVIVDDGSTDSTRKYLNWLKETHPEGLKIAHSEYNRGRCAARNAGNAEASGDIIAVLDADDYCHPQRATKTVEKIKSGVDYVYGSAEMIDVFSRTMGTIQADVFNLEKASETLENRIVHSTVAYTKEIASRFPYDAHPETSALGIDDWEHEIRIAKAGVKMDFIPSVLCGYRVLSNSITATRDPHKVIEAKKRILGVKEEVLA